MNGIAVNPTAVPAGDYQVLVVDSSQCETLDTISVLGPPSLSFTTSITNVSCNGFNDGRQILLLKWQHLHLLIYGVMVILHRL